MRNRLVGAIIILAAAIALAVTLLTSYNERKTAECQGKVNAQFLAVQRERATINDGDRDSVRTLFETLVDTSDQVKQGKLSPQEAEKINNDAISQYFSTQKDLDQQRKDHPLPDIVQCDGNTPVKKNTKDTK